MADVPYIEVKKEPNIDELIAEYAVLYDVSEYVMHTVINCESGYNPQAFGDHGNSRGLVQIHKPSHPTITDEQAYDPDFSIRFLAQKLAEGKGSMWTCYRKFF